MRAAFVVCFCCTCSFFEVQYLQLPLGGSGGTITPHRQHRAC